jgi:hypothetical protein
VTSCNSIPTTDEAVTGSRQPGSGGGGGHGGSQGRWRQTGWIRGAWLALSTRRCKPHTSVVGSSHRIGDSYSSEDPRNHIFEFTARRTLTPRITRSPLKRHSEEEGTRLLAQMEKQRRRRTTGVVHRMGRRGRHAARVHSSGMGRRTWRCGMCGRWGKRIG